MFPIDKEGQPEVEIRGSKDHPHNTLRFLRGVWNDEKLIPKLPSDFKWEAILEENSLLSGFQKELLARR